MMSKRLNVNALKNRLQLTLFIICIGCSSVGARNVTFCGERIPVDNDFVANKLMNVIRKQVPNANLPSLRQRVQIYFPVVEAYLRKYGLPEDLKYLAIVESGFVSHATSRVGARGFWQIMPATAKGYGMNIDGPVDERDDIHKSTNVACRLLTDNYNYIKKVARIGSWALACAAYNFGIGNISKAIKAQGTNYYTMELNAETAVYVYKIIAIKELFEFPELYMDKFGYNVFSTTAKKKKGSSLYGDEGDEVFKKMKVKKEKESIKKSDTTFYVAAHVEVNKKFEEGDFVSITLDEDMRTTKGLVFKGSNIAPIGWVIDDRIMVDMGYGHDLLLYDLDMKKGVPLEKMREKNKKGIPVLLKVTNYF